MASLDENLACGGCGARRRHARLSDAGQPGAAELSDLAEGGAVRSRADADSLPEVAPERGGGAQVAASCDLGDGGVRAL
jgi:hypothetical protein